MQTVESTFSIGDMVQLNQTESSFNGKYGHISQLFKKDGIEPAARVRFFDGQEKNALIVNLAHWQHPRASMVLKPPMVVRHKQSGKKVMIERVDAAGIFAMSEDGVPFSNAIALDFEPFTVPAKPDWAKPNTIMMRGDLLEPGDVVYFAKIAPTRRLVAKASEGEWWADNFISNSAPIRVKEPIGASRWYVIRRAVG